MPTTRHQATLEKDEATNDVKVQAGEKRKGAPAAKEAEPKPKASKVKAEPKRKEEKQEEDHDMKDIADDQANGHTNGKANGHSNGHSNGDSNGPSVEEKKQVAQSQGKSDAPSNVATDYSDESTTLERGIIYFFFRPKVEVEEPQSLDDVQRGYLVLRPLAEGEKVPNGPLKDSKNLRLLAVPKKSLPSKGGRVLSFVEKGKTSTEELKESFLTDKTNETKTMGTRHTGAPIPICEGVYSLIHANKSTHLAYITTAPAEIGPVQQKFGVHNQGTFVVQVRNPSFESPPYARLPETAKYPKDMVDEFQDLRWLPLHTKHLDYDYCEILFIGEAQEGLPSEQTKENGNKAGAEAEEKELEKAEDELKDLEGVDEDRIKHLKHDHAIFDDLKLSAKDYPDIMTQWD